MPIATRSETALQMDLSWLNEKLDEIPIGRVGVFFEAGLRGDFRWFFGNCSALGWSADQFVNVDLLDLFHRDDKKAFLGVIHSVAARDEIVVDRPFRLRCKNGAWRKYSAYGWPNLDPEGDVKGVVGVIVENGNYN